MYYYLGWYKFILVSFSAVFIEIYDFAWIFLRRSLHAINLISLHSFDQGHLSINFGWILIIILATLQD